MPRLVTATLGLGIALAPRLHAQEGDALPTEYVVHVPPGAWIDLDTGVLLPRAEHQRMRADLRFGRDGGGLYLEPLRGGARAARADTDPPDDLATERLRIGRHDQDALIAFARTDRGMARVELLVADTYSTGSAALRFVIVQHKQPRFLPAATDLSTAWQRGELVARWRGDYPRWHVMLESGEERRIVLTPKPEAQLGKLDEKRHHRVTVRGMTANGDLSMPADAVQFGPRQTPRIGRVDYPDRWYDQAGGLSLIRNEACDGDADVVFYLYGVHVPGGGVVKVGTGRKVFTALHELPAGPFPPTYGRIDDHDVLVVRVADGRYAKLWLEPIAKSDLRNGMRVHTVWLPDGRRHLLAPPGAATSTHTPRGVELRWEAVAEAASYRVTVAETKPIECPRPELLLPGLAPERLYPVRIEAIGADGERSLPSEAVVHTYPGEVRMGRGRLRAQDGSFDFATGKNAAQGDLQITGGAGGAQVLYLAGQIAPGAAFAFGELPALERLSLAETWTSDESKPGEDHFYVRTRDGGLASVRWRKRGWPESEFEYVWRPAK